MKCLNSTAEKQTGNSRWHIRAILDVSYVKRNTTISKHTWSMEWQIKNKNRPVRDERRVALKLWGRCSILVRECRLFELLMSVFDDRGRARRAFEWLISPPEWFCFCKFGILWVALDGSKSIEKVEIYMLVSLWCLRRCKKLQKWLTTVERDTLLEFGTKIFVGSTAGEELGFCAFLVVEWEARVQLRKITFRMSQCCPATAVGMEYLALLRQVFHALQIFLFIIETACIILMTEESNSTSQLLLILFQPVVIAAEVEFTLWEVWSLACETQVREQEIFHLMFAHSMIAHIQSICEFGLVRCFLLGRLAYNWRGHNGLWRNAEGSQITPLHSLISLPIWLAIKIQAEIRVPSPWKKFTRLGLSICQSDTTRGYSLGQNVFFLHFAQ